MPSMALKKDKPRPGSTKTTDKRIQKLLQKRQQGFARWTVPVPAEALGDVDVQYVWRFLRSHKNDLAARTSCCECNDPNLRPKPPMLSKLYLVPPVCIDEKAVDPGFGASAGLSEAAPWPQPWPEPRPTRHGTAILFAAFEVATGKIMAAHSNASPRRVSRLHESVAEACRVESFTAMLAISTPTGKTNIGRPILTCNFISSDRCVPAQSGRDMGSILQPQRLAAPPLLASTLGGYGP
ncbi:hypothetical protein ABH999_000658 [Bradyrhizobium yuanmingense]